MQRLIGESSTLVETLSHVSRVATVNRPVLVVGERGSGKEMIAERLHYLSQRWEEQFHKVNCAAITESLLDSELFGHEAGAFTGASKRHQGIFERVDGGTLFLDELATTPLRIQEKLLRVIEYGEFERVGGSTTLRVDVRIVAATNEHLPDLVEAGKFRADLLDRLAFDVIQVPPLRERVEDIASLVEFFATRMCLEIGRSYYSGFSSRALQILENHSWPGNIRELKNVVERSVCHWLNSDEPIDEVPLDPFQRPASTKLPSINTTKLQIDDGSTVNFASSVKAFELQLLREALQHCQHHQTRTAEYLGLSYHQLRALLKKYRAELQT